MPNSFPTSSGAYSEANPLNQSNTKASSDPTSEAHGPKRPCLRLALTISILNSIVMLPMGSAALLMAYFVSLDSVEDIGMQFLRSATEAGVAKTELFFNRPAENGQALQRGIRDFLVFPSEDPTIFEVLNRTLGIVRMTLYNSGVGTLTSVILADGSAIVTGYERVEAIGLLFSVMAMNGVSFSPNATCCGTYYSASYPPYSSTPVDRGIPFSEGGVDLRFNEFYGLAKTLETKPDGLWNDPLAVIGDDLTVYFALPYLLPIRNATHMLGLGVIQVGFSALIAFLKTIPRSANGHLFVLGSVDGDILATTHPSPFIDEFMTTSRLPDGRSNCANSGVYARDTNSSMSQHLVLCRKFAKDFAAYPAIGALLDTSPELLSPPPGSRLTTTFAADGPRYFAGVAALAVRGAFFRKTMFVVMPDTDILAALYERRNITIGVVVGVFFLASAASFALVTLLIQPLTIVSSRMRATATLSHEAVEDESVVDAVARSAFAELHDLGTAYRQLDTAVAAFTRYVPKDVVKELVQTGKLCRVHMEPLHCSVLFVDIVSFTRMCEQLTPTTLSRLVATYFDTMTKAVLEYGGLIDKFVGDCIMALWGAPFPVANGEIRATLCALRMMQEAEAPALADEFESAGTHLAMRAGLSSGPVLAGNMGSSVRLSYTVIGDDVNLASRLESLNKQFGTSVMVSESTANKLHDAFVLRLLGAIPVARRSGRRTYDGEAPPVPIYEVVGLRSAASDAARNDTSSVFSKDSGRSDLHRYSTRPSFRASMLAEESQRRSTTTTTTTTATKVSRSAGRRLQTDVSLLLEEALRHHPLMVATDTSTTAAEAHTEAATLYTKGQFDRCIEVLESEIPAGGDPTRSQELLLAAARRHLRRPLDDFVGALLVSDHV